MPKRKTDNQEIPFLPEKLRQIRIEKGLNQRDLAKNADLAPSTISSLEKGTVRPSWRTVRQLAQILGIEESFLTGNLTSNHNSNTSNLVSDKTLLENVDENDARLNLVVTHLSQGQYQEALANLIQLDETTLKQEQQISKNFLQAQIYNRTGSNRQARELLHRLQGQIKRGTDSKPALAELYFELGLSYLQERQAEAAIEQYNLALVELDAVALTSKLGFIIYADLVQLYQQLEQYEQAEKIYQKVQSHPLYLEDDRTRAASLQAQGTLLIKQGKFAEGSQLLAESIQLFEKLELIEHAQTVNSYYRLVQVQNASELQLQNVIEPLDLNVFNPVNKVTILGNTIAYYRKLAENSRDIKEILEKGLTQVQLLQIALKEYPTHLPYQPKIQALFEQALLFVACVQHLDKKYQAQAQECFDLILDILVEVKAARLHFDRVYDAYEEALLDWGLDNQLAQLAKRRRSERKLLESSWHTNTSKDSDSIPV